MLSREEPIWISDLLPFCESWLVAITFIVFQGSIGQTNTAKSKLHVGRIDGTFEDVLKRFPWAGHLLIGHAATG